MSVTNVWTLFFIGHTHSPLTIQESGKTGVIFPHARSELTAQNLKAPNAKMVLHLNDSTIPKLINSGLLRRQLNCIWKVCFLKFPVSAPYTRNAGCRLRKVIYEHTPLQASGMGLRIPSQLQSNVNWLHQLLWSIPCCFNSAVTVYFDVSLGNEKLKSNLLYKNL